MLSRPTRPFAWFAAAVACAAPSFAFASTLTVGPGNTYPTPCAAVAAAAPNDVILISPGAAAYTDTCRLDVAGITLKGVGGQPKVDVSGTVPLATFSNGSENLKGIYDVTADGITIENLELAGANIGDSAAGNGANGAAIRVEASGLTVTGCYIHDNQDGILVSAPNPGSTLTVEYTNFDHNALGDGCGGPGCTHNIYVNVNIETLIFAFNWSHNAGDGNAAGNGHLFKSRAQKSYVLYNALLGEAGDESYELDLPNGGLAVVVGNVIQKSASAGNPNVLSYGEEGLTNTGSEIYVVNNTFASNDTSGSLTFLKLAGGTLTAHNNLFGAMGTPSTTGALSADNLMTTAPLFVSPGTYDYHLTMGSPAIGLGVAPGSAGSFPLTPEFEWVAPTDAVARAVGAKLDLGAFQFGTNVSGAGQSEMIGIADGGAPVVPDATAPVADSGATDAGHVADAAVHPSDAGRAADAGAGGGAGLDAGGDAGSGASSSSGGCSCRTSGLPRDASSGWLASALSLVVLGLARRRCR